MKIILEESEIVGIIAEHFELDRSKMKFNITTNPLEMTLLGVPLPRDEEPSSGVRIPIEMLPLEKTSVDYSKRDLEGATDEPPPVGADGVELDKATDLSPAALVAQSRQLEERLRREGGGPPPQRKGGSTRAPSSDGTDEV